MILSLASSLALATASPLITPDEMAEATATFTSWCASAVKDRIDRTPACACGTGILSERLSDAEFVLMAGLTAYVGDEAGMEKAVNALIEEDDLSPAFIRNAARKNAEAAGRADRVCSVLERPAEQWRMMAEVNGANSPYQPASLPRPATTPISALFRHLSNSVHAPADRLAGKDSE